MRATSILAVSMMLIAIVSVRAQPGAPDAVPRELVAALLSFEQVGDIHVGAAAPGLPVDAAPPNTIVLGSLVFPSRSTTVFVLGESRDAAFETVDARLTAAGWKRAFEGEPMPRGFVMASLDQPRGFCRGTEFILPAIVARAGGGFLLKVHHERGQRSPLCGEVPFRRHDMLEDTPLPVLRAPKGVVQRGGGSAGGGDGVSEISAHLQTTMSAGDLAAHYAGELRQAGWMPEEESTSGAVVVQLFRFADAQAGTWWGALSAFAVPESDVRIVSLKIGRRQSHGAL